MNLERCRLKGRCLTNNEGNLLHRDVLKALRAKPLAAFAPVLPEVETQHPLCFTCSLVWRNILKYLQTSNLQVLDPNSPAYGLRSLNLLCEIQDRCPEAQTAGARRGAFDMLSWQWGGSHQLEGGLGSIYSGWTNAPINNSI